VRNISTTRSVPFSARLGGSAVVAFACAIWLWPAWPPAANDVEAASATRFDESQLWLRPLGGEAPALGEAAADLAAGRAKDALPVFRAATRDPVLGHYARLYQGRAELELDRPSDAEASARAIIESAPGGYLGEAALWLLADAAEAQKDWPEARRALEALTGLVSSSASLAYLRLGRTALEMNDLAAARAALSTVFYDYPLSDEAAEAEAPLKTLVVAGDPDRVTRDLARAEALYVGRRYADARRAYAGAAKGPGADPALAAVRVAECDFYLGHYKAALDALRPIAERGGPRAEEAEYFVVSATRLLKRDAEYLTRVRAFVDRYPDRPLAETVLNDLATYHILADDDADAAAVFTDMLRRFPQGAYAERAAWKAGWWAYKSGAYREAIRVFRIGLENFSRSDYRPSWLYWTARSQGKLGETAAAAAGYRQTIASYRNSYYGRQALRALADLPVSADADAVPVVARTSPAALRPSPFPGATAIRVETGRDTPVPVTTTIAVAPGAPPANAPLIRALLVAGLNDDAVAELRKTQREQGTSPFIEATIAYALNRKGDLRAAVNAMRRAYPQFMAEGGEALPPDMLKVIFPLDYWDLIQRRARAANLDPYLTAALVAQESTFQAAIRSSANAWGLMQILPSTGRRYAPFLGLGRFTTSRLTDPDVNVRIGTAYFADLMKQFGDPALALAAYNAGENRVARWQAERPGVDRDEFIDDIPFPETQNYVKRILGTAEDYRILYGPAAAAVR
jgi:soluble lytic murein transglycosylase